MAIEKSGTRFLTRKEMQTWFKEEMRNVLKEGDLRVRDATEFAMGYITGELTAQQAHERLKRYDERWGDPLAGVYASSFQSDQSIVDAIDALRRGEKTRSHVERIERGSSNEPAARPVRGR